jgi:hypothetical protein
MNLEEGFNLIKASNFLYTLMLLYCLLCDLCAIEKSSDFTLFYRRFCCLRIKMSHFYNKLCNFIIQFVSEAFHKIIVCQMFAHF